MNKRLWIDYSKVRSALSFGTVLNYYKIEHPLDKNQVKVICPFHDERTASLSINLEAGKFQCFGCGAKGDLITFVRETEGLDFAGSIEWLGERTDQVSPPSPRTPGARYNLARCYEELGKPDLAKQWLESDKESPQRAGNLLRAKLLDTKGATSKAKASE